MVTDGKGNYLAYKMPVKIRSGTAWTRPVLYWGDGRVFYRLSVRARAWMRGNLDRSIAIDFSRFLAPSGALQVISGQGTLRCKDRTRRFNEVDAKTLARIRSSARIQKRPARRVPRFLARDDDGVYFYVDRSGDRSRNFDLRLYRGRQGSMKRLKLKNVVNDASGMLLVAREGRLKLDVIGHDRSKRWSRVLGNPRWIVGGKRRRTESLTKVSVAASRSFIAGELGVYLGQKSQTPCDWL